MDDFVFDEASRVIFGKGLENSLADEGNDITRVKKFASLLSADSSNFEKVITGLEKSGCEGFHFDIMDGHFVKNFAFSPKIIKSLRRHTRLPFQAHLEIENPGEYIDMFIDAGCDMVTVHPQTCKVERELRYLRAKNILSSVAIDPDINIVEVFDYLNLVDNIIVMSVYPGFGHQSFIAGTLEKIKKLKEKILSEKLNITISIDGGVSKENEPEIIESGCDILIYGSSLFK
jgi:ribulose-phosphate 3-epimerase